jgi:hypothetical protein
MLFPKGKTYEAKKRCKKKGILIIRKYTFEYLIGGKKTKTKKDWLVFLFSRVLKQVKNSISDLLIFSRFKREKSFSKARGKFPGNFNFSL